MFGRAALSIAVVAPLVAPVGGAEPDGNHALLVDLARGLAGRGHRVRLYAAEGSQVAGVQVVGIRLAPGMRESFARLFRRLRADAPDAVSQHAFDAEAIEFAEGLPVLHTLHLPPLVDALVQACRQSEAALAAVSAFSAAQWRAAGLERVQEIRNGVAELELPGGAVAPVALIAGRICPEKGTAAAIRAALAAGLQARVVGGVYDRQYFDREVAPLLGPRASVERCLARAELRAAMARAAVCLMPVDWDEPFGQVGAEAQLAGCPVAGYARGALPEIVEEGVSGILVLPGDEAALAAAARHALSLDRRAVRASARARLLLEPTLDRYENELRAVAERHAPRCRVIDHPALSRAATPQIDSRR